MMDAELRAAFGKIDQRSNRIDQRLDTMDTHLDNLSVKLDVFQKKNEADHAELKGILEKHSTILDGIREMMFKTTV